MSAMSRILKLRKSRDKENIRRDNVEHKNAIKAL